MSKPSALHEMRAGHPLRSSGRDGAAISGTSHIDHSATRHSRRTAAGMPWSRLAATIALASLFILSACVLPGPSACPDDDEPAKPTLHIYVPPERADGTVTTSGDCTTPTCMHSDGVLCTTWVAEMTRGDGGECQVTLTEPNGSSETKTVIGHHSCNRISSQGIGFPRDF